MRRTPQTHRARALKLLAQITIHPLSASPLAYEAAQTGEYASIPADELIASAKAVLLAAKLSGITVTTKPQAVAILRGLTSGRR